MEKEEEQMAAELDSIKIKEKKEKVKKMKE